MSQTRYVPHIDLILKSLRIGRERLLSQSKIAIDTELLRALLSEIVSLSEFSRTVYLATYPDIAAAADAGQVTNLLEHYVEQGYFEGRVGTVPDVDEDFYLASYPDVRAAVSDGSVPDAAEHYVRAGAAEGRIPNPGLKREIDRWMSVLRLESPARS